MTRPPRIDHVGVIVDDLDAAVAHFGALLGGPPAEIVALPVAGLRVARFEAANIAIELLEYTSGKGGLGYRAMGGASGLNHLSIETADLDGARARWEAAGLTVQDGFPCPGARGQVIFFEREPSSGVLFELCETPTDGAGKGAIDAGE